VASAPDDQCRRRGGLAHPTVSKLPGHTEHRGQPGIAALLRLKILIASLASQPVRALIAGAMVSLGVAATLVMVALGTGARLEMQALQESVGRNLFFVRAGERPLPPGRGNGWFVSSRLKPADAVLIESSVSSVAHAVPVRQRSVVVKLGRNRVATTVRGVTPEFFELRRLAIETGRAIVDSDGASLRRVAVVGAFVRQRLAGGQSLIGATLRIAGVPFEVVGELRAKGTGSDGSDQDDQILVPFESAMRRLDNVEAVSMLLVQSRDELEMEGAIDGVRQLLRATHYIEPGAREDFDILQTIRQSEAQRLSGKWMRGLSGILAAVTLVLGAVGVFAVSYLNVKERTAEIGLRMAVGATRPSIAMLFVVESCALSLAGGVAGLALGALIAVLMKTATVWSLVLDLSTVSTPLALSAFIGVVCSVVPAWRASRVMPAVALAG
jgi:putative ABC transport system permease protein